MTTNIILPTISAALSIGIAVFVLLRGSGSFAYRIFAVGMALLGLEEAILAFGLRMFSPSEVIRWQWIRLCATGLLPGTWLLFSLSFARANYKEFLRRWKWVALALYLSPIVLLTFFRSSVFVAAGVFDRDAGWYLQLGWAGYAYHLFYLVGAVLILVNMEKTLRGFTGSMQWQIKFMVLGVMGLFALRIYTSSQVLLYSTFNTSTESLYSGGIVIACALMIVSLVRAHLSDINIYISQTLLYNSLTILIVGAYLILVGLLAQAITYFGGNLSLPLENFFVFLALIALAAFMLSGNLRLKFKQFVNLHLRHPHYDYRKEWRRFTQQTLSIVDMRALCTAVTKIVSETFGSPAVSIWLLDESSRHLTLGGSTFHSMSRERSFKTSDGAFADILESMRANPVPMLLRRQGNGWVDEVEKDDPERSHEIRTWCCAPLLVAGEFLGFMTLSERVNGGPFSEEDFALIKTIADQAAGSLLNLRLSERLHAAKQLEAFQTLSAFFVHDLKNLASTLSLTLQNLPVHYDNPEFREDALKMIAGSVDKINTMCSRLSTLRERLDLNRTTVDLNALILSTLSNLSTSVKGTLIQDLQPLPKASVDADQIQKVVTNLVLNAHEAIRGKGQINVETAQQNGCAVLSVTDNGCGISKEFLEKSLFHPFKTTKKKGLGIGLFQCKRIVEAHKGRIEVESEEGKGTTFRIVLPLE